MAVVLELLAMNVRQPRVAAHVADLLIFDQTHRLIV